jgi:hypothetical protein
MTIRARQVAATLLAPLLCNGCVATKYQLARHDAPPAQTIDHPFPPSGELEARLVGLITYHGPGSWKREALWDEYVVTLRNAGERPITVESAVLINSAGRAVAPGTDPWELEKQTKALEKQYRLQGEAFVRAAGPGVLLVGTGAVAAAATTSGWALVSPAAAGAVLAAVFVVPVYYTTIVAIDYHNKHQVRDEFRRRRLAAPLILAPGETRTASLFFPMIRSPAALDLNWRSEAGQVQAALPLEFLRDLHVPAPRNSRPSEGTDPGARDRP